MINDSTYITACHYSTTGYTAKEKKTCAWRQEFGELFSIPHLVIKVRKRMSWTYLGQQRRHICNLAHYIQCRKKLKVTPVSIASLIYYGILIFLRNYVALF